MPELIDLTGMRFGRLTVISHAGKASYGENRWHCKCDCGTETIVFGNLLRNGSSKSCGCLARELSSSRNRTHGMTNTRLFDIWHGMKARCCRPTAPNYSLYGGRGISVCEEWKNDFTVFYEWAMSHGYADGLTLDRIDNDGNYSPDNCRWADGKTQANNKSTNRLITANGETHTLTQWAEILDVIPESLSARLKRGWSEERTINTPMKKYRRRNHESTKHCSQTASH